MKNDALFDGLSIALARNGLILRGGFNFAADDDPPSGPSGATAKAVLLIGQAGGAPWPYFEAWRAKQPPGIENPLDDWAREIIGATAEEFGARAVSPSDQPYLPFQRWAMRAERLKLSPLGILMHPQYGLWHAYRGGLLFDDVLIFPTPRQAIHLCDSCVEKPCLNACPVNAFLDEGFAHDACLAHVRGSAGAACRDSGCLARNACPFGIAFRYTAREQAFHMRAFMR
ncbi:MAG TPA: hypothetical protein VHC00_13270 [Rhizobiaceae bacterium]|nr:hypothetical protein [Rhizobiaceae bacterium]